MIANDSLTPEAQQTQLDRKRKRKAILAGGVVLGLGAAITLAAWSDDVFADGTFQTGTFNLVGSQALASADPADYAAYSEIAPADLTTGSTDGGVDFKINSLNLTPGETVVAPFSVATSTDTTVDGRYWLAEATAVGPLAEFLSFKIIESATCAADDPALTTDTPTSFAAPWKEGIFTVAAPTVTFASIRSEATPGHDIALAEGLTGQSHLCIGVTLENEEDDIKDANANGTQGETSILWHFAGESLPLTN